MRKIAFLVCLFIITEVVAGDGPSLVWVKKQDLLPNVQPTICEAMGDFLIVELPPSDLNFLKKAGIEYEIIDLNSAQEDYWLVADVRAQGFSRLPDLAEILRVHGDAALVKGDRKIIEQQVPGLGYELIKLFRHPLRSPRKPLLRKGGLGDIVEQVSADSIESYIRWLENFGTRWSHAYGCTLAAYGLYDKFQEYGLEVEYFGFSLGLNVVATLPGADYPDIVYIICGHYDSISGEDSDSCAPGADDNASGTAAVIEAARVLRNYVPRATVKFICFAGEEQGLHGSYAYARYADSIGMNIGGVLNFDMIAYCDVEDYFDVNVHTDGNSESLADLLITESQNYTALIPRKVMGGGGSDHAPFWWYGYPAILAIERATDHWNPYYHSTGDTTGTLTIPFATEVVKLGVAGLLRLARFFPEVSYYDSEWTDSEGDGHADPGDTVTVTVSLFNSGKSASAVEAKLSSDDSFITIADSSSDFGEILSDSIKENSSDPFVIVVDPGAPLHICTLHVAITADSLNFSGSFSLMIGIPPVLVVDDDGGDSYETYFTNSLQRTSVLFDLLDKQDGMTSSYLSDYEALILLTGDNSSPFDSSELLALSNYLDSGGNLFITGQDVEACADTSFYRDYLHAEIVQDSADRDRVFGVDGDLIGDGLRFFIAGLPGAFNQVSPTIISPTGGADSVFTYWEGGCSGLKHGDGYKIVYLSFGFEAISPLSAADTVMIRILKWFGLPVSVEEEVLCREPLGTTLILRTQPNPFRDELQIEYLVVTPSMLRLQLYDVAGRMVRELIRESHRSGVHRIKWDGTNSVGSRVPQGVYFLHLSDGSENRVKKCILLR